MANKEDDFGFIPDDENELGFVPDEPEQKPVAMSQAPVKTQEPETVEDKNLIERAVDFASDSDPLAYLGAVGPTLAKKATGIIGLTDDRPMADIYKENVQTVKDLRKGLTQGALMGGSDEIQGALAATAGKVTGEEGSLTELYRKYQKIAEGKQKEAKERSPYAYGGGEIAGAVGAALATGGLGIEAGLAGKMGSVGVKEALKQGGKLAAAKEVGKRALAAGVEGAVGGGIQGGLSSEKTLEDASSLGKDIVSGATFGLAGGAALRGAGDVVPAAAAEVGELGMRVASKPFKMISKERTEQIKTIWDRVRNDLPVDYEDLRLAGELEGIEDSVLKKFTGARQTLGNKLNAAYQLAEQQGRVVDIGEPLEQAAARFQAFAKNTPALGFENIPEYKKLMEKVYLIKGNRLSPLQARTLAKEVGELASKLKNPQMSEIAGNFSSSVRESLEKAVPEAAVLSKQYHQFNKFGLETLAGRGKVNPKDVSGFTPVDKVGERQSLKWLLKRITTPGVPQEEVSNALHYMKSNLAELERQSPGVFEALGIKNIDELDDMLRDKSKLYSIANVLSSASASRGGEPMAKNPIAFFAQGVSPIATKGAYVGTKMAAKGMRKVDKLVDFGRELTTMPEDALGNVADILLKDQSKSAKQAGQFLKDALQNKDSVKRNAALFIIQQNPKYRNLVREGLFGEEQGDEQQ